MSESIQYWATTNAGNANSDPAISSSDTQAPNTVATNIRSIMAALAKYHLDANGGLTAGGTANALTVTTNQVLISAQLTGGLAIMVKAASTNTSATVTFAPDGLTAAAIKRADGSALAVGSIQAGMFLFLVYDAGSSSWWCANIPPAAVGGGVSLLTSGTWSAQATGDIVLSAYTGYRGFQFVLSGLVPVSSNVPFGMQVSSNGGNTYDNGSNNYTWILSPNNISTNDTLMHVTNGSSNVAGFGTDCIVTILNTSAAMYPKVVSQASAAGGNPSCGGGIRNNSQATTAVRFLFTSGNISAGNYAVYGLN